jgi:cytoskeleton-associated protein 5
MAFVYSGNAGDDVWRYVGKLSDAQRSMLDDRFKWKVIVYDPTRPFFV